MARGLGIKNWKNILWREWRHCGDKDYARRLYHAVAGGPFNWFNKLTVRRQPRPHAAEVEAALYEVCRARWGGKYVWQKHLRRLEQAKAKSIPLQNLIADLENRHWLKRFIARHVLLYRGSEAVAALQTLAQDDTHQSQQTARWLVESICEETIARLAKVADERLCPDCLVHCHAHWLDRARQPDLSYYGCRYCRRSYGLLDCPEGIVAVLDASWLERYKKQDDVVYANWLMHRAVFDFDRVEIIRATDEDVERFAVQVGNDTDALRRPQYEQMHCYVNAECQLSKNTVRILESMFGQVERAGV